MADRGKRGRGRSTQRRPQEQVQPAQSLPHSRAVGSGEAIRRPGESVSIPTLVSIYLLRNMIHIVSHLPYNIKSLDV